MTMSLRVRRGLLVVMGVLVALGAAELAFRTLDWYVLAANGVSQNPHAPNALYVLTREPQRYELRPELHRYRGRIDINALGLRGPEVPPASPGEFRVLFVGDSVTFGGEWRYEAGFPVKVAEDLQRSGRPRFAHALGLNGGVPGYSPFNELYWLRDKGPLLHPDAIVIQFCLNDVVDPLPQWNLMLGGALAPADIPADAIPNPAAHRRLLRLMVLRRFRLFDFLDSFWSRQATIDGWPAYLTEEQSMSIDIYSHPRSPEIRWLHGMYAALVAEARRETPNVLILFVPLAYQLEPGYPVHSPQQVLESIARENHVPLVDLTPALEPLGPLRSFRLGSPGSQDVWHLSEEGHTVAARVIADALLSRVGANADR